MERTLSVNYPVLRQNKRVLHIIEYVREKPLSLRFLASRINVH